jgi:hypothetical protein
MPEVGKYDALVVWQRADGRRWSVHLARWVAPDSNEFTSWLDTDENPEVDEWLSSHPNSLPPGGEWININEA